MDAARPTRAKDSKASSVIPELIAQTGSEGIDSGDLRPTAISVHRSLERVLRFEFFLLLAANLACAPKVLEQPTPQSMPILPSYKAQVYTLAPTQPRDPMVRDLLGTKPYDESLAGAATALSLLLSRGESTDSADVNWACQRSGWPYLLSAHRQLILPKDSVPVGLLDGLRLTQHSRLGVVRARSSESDIWVLLQSEVPTPLAPVAMSYRSGETLDLPTSSEASLAWLAVDPTGALVRPDNRLDLNREGEWLIEASIEEHVLFRAALYVDMDVPEVPLFETAAEDGSPRDHAEQASEMLSLAHQIFFAVDTPLQRDPSLDRSAAMALQASLRGQSVSSADLRFEQLGFTRTPRNEIGCSGASVRECLDSLFWSATARSQLLDGEYSVLGVAAADLGNDQLALLLNLAAE